PVELPPSGRGGVQFLDHLPEPRAQQVALVLEVHVERRARQARLGHQPLDAELRIALPLGQQLLDDGEQPAPNLVASLRAIAMALAGDGWHQRVLAYSVFQVMSVIASSNFSIAAGVAGATSW